MVKLAKLMKLVKLAKLAKLVKLAKLMKLVKLVKLAKLAKLAILVKLNVRKRMPRWIRVAEGTLGREWSGKEKVSKQGDPAQCP